MTPRFIITSLSIACAALVTGCANDGSNGLSTASVAPEKIAQAPKVDPVCASLASHIDTLRKEGTVERLEKAAAGKSSSVQVKRTALAKQAELNKANADYQAKCGPQIPAAQTAQAAPASAAQIAPIATAAATSQATGQAKAAATTAAKAAVSGN